MPQSALGASYPVSPVAWNRFFGVAGNHDYHDPLTSSLNLLSGRGDYDSWFMPSSQNSENVVPLAAQYSHESPYNNRNVDYSNPYYDYMLSPINSKGESITSLANFYMFDGHQAAIGNEVAKSANSSQSLAILGTAKSRPNNATWQIAASHYPQFSSAEPDSTIPDWDFAGSGIDLVLDAHIHN